MIDMKVQTRKIIEHRVDINIHGTYLCFTFAPELYSDRAPTQQQVLNYIADKVLKIDSEHGTNDLLFYKRGSGTNLSYWFDIKCKNVPEAFKHLTTAFPVSIEHDLARDLAKLIFNAS
jgi:hypothetical protein